MTFEEYMQTNYSDWLKSEKEFNVSPLWLKAFWEAAQANLERAEPDTGPEGLVQPKDMPFVPKSWGYELWITNNNRYCGKKLFIKQGRCCSFHHHNIKDEVLYVESGRIEFTQAREPTDHVKTTLLDAGNAFHVKPGLIHQMYAVEDTVIFEISTQHFDSDSHRTTTKYIAWSPMTVEGIGKSA